LVLASSWIATGAEPAVPPPLTTCADVRALTQEQAQAGRQVRLRGVVTFVPPWPWHFTISDGTGLWVGPPAIERRVHPFPSLRPGDLVEVEGHTTEGHFAPIVAADRIVAIGRAVLPAPQRIAPVALESGFFDSQRVVLDGVVQAAEVATWEGQPLLRLRISTPAGEFTYEVFANQPPAAPSLVDAEVSVSGVLLSYFNTRRQYLGARVSSNDRADLVVLRPAPGDAFAAPEVPLGKVMVFSPAQPDRHRRRVQGTVTLCKPGHYLYLQDGSSSLRLNTRQREVFTPGDVVEAAGFFHLKHNKAEMHDALLRRVRPGPAPAPVEITREMAFIREPRNMAAQRRDFDDSLVALRGTLISIDHKPGEPLRLNLECDGALVPAEFSGDEDTTALSALLPGSRLRVSGICEVSFSDSRPVRDWPQPVALRLLIRHRDDVEIIQSAAWWTPERLRLALGAAALVLFLALAWVVLLRRTVAVRGTQLAEAMRARRDAAVEFESTLRERNRLAADLHDTTEQSLTGLALQLKTSAALHTKAPERSSQHLILARQLLDRSREDLRRSIWNLRATPLEKNTLTGALREVAADRSAGHDVSIVVREEGQPRPLVDFVAGNLLLLAQEGITNALKHAQPGSIALDLRFSESVVTLVIRDDGIGFDPAAAAGPPQGHFGLQGMRERIKRLGGTISITSAPGQGTTLTAQVPG
jgi:signal transduction histidine kinase